MGYVNETFQPGNNWFGNPLDNEANNLLSDIIPSAPLGTTVSLWNSVSDSFGPTATWNGTLWSAQLTLAPGTGALLDTPSPFTNAFVGEVLDLGGSVYTDPGAPLKEPPPFGGPSGRYLFSSKAPLALSGHVFNGTEGEYSVFESIIGRAPEQGDQVTTLNSLTQTTTTSTFSGGAWDVDPTLGVGQAAFFTLVPEPSAVALFLVGLVTIRVAGRQRSVLR